MGKEILTYIAYVLSAVGFLYTAVIASIVTFKVWSEDRGQEKVLSPCPICKQKDGIYTSLADFKGTCWSTFCGHCGAVAPHRTIEGYLSKEASEDGWNSFSKEYS